MSVNANGLSVKKAPVMSYRLLFFHRRSTISVSFSDAPTMDFLMLLWIGASTVHMNRVPMLMPQAPSASAPASPCPSANPPVKYKVSSCFCDHRGASALGNRATSEYSLSYSPDAMKGILPSSCLARESRMKFGISVSPTCPAHSKPSMLRKSTPSLTALSACLIVVPNR